MNRSNFIALLEDSKAIEPEAIPSLQSLAAEYPFFQTAQLLLCKAFQQSENINFEYQLRKTAAFASDRKRLHELVFSEVESTVEAPEESRVAEESIETTQPESDILPINLETSEGKSPLEEQIISSAISNSIFLEVPDEISPEDLDSLRPKPLDDEPAFEEAESKEEKFNLSSPHSFSEWLSFYSDNSSKSDERELAEENEFFDMDLENSLSEPSSLPVRREFYSPAKMAKLSVQEDDDLVTETLAQVYADQGNLEKAIKAFQKLQLKYPEKKIYFAGRIKELEIQLNKL